MWHTEFPRSCLSVNELTKVSRSCLNDRRSKRSGNSEGGELHDYVMICFSTTTHPRERHRVIYTFLNTE